MALTPGTRLGPYDILAPLGAGGMGEVYKARDTRLARTVAIKVLPADTAADASARARFEREARAIAALSHPHICVVYDVGHQDGIDYLVMELLEGETLAERLAKAKGPLPLDAVLSIGAAIADALDKAHRAGIVHRDLKPANVMLTKSGPKLLDFGLAKLHGAASPVSLSNETAATTAGPGTAQGTILGTIHYMAPEQVEGRDADTRTDIWALGALLYEMATGQRPFTGESAASIIGAILKDTPPALSARQPLTPPAFEHLVERCLAKDLDERWQNAGDVKRELTWIAARRAGKGDGEPLPLGQAPVRAASRVATLLPWALAALLAAAAVPAVRHLRESPVPAPPEAPMVTFDIRTPPTDEGSSFELSPDGQQLVFVAARDGEPSRLWIRALAEKDARPLPGTEGATYPFWSPDSRSIGFFADRKVKRLDLSGGSPLVLASATNGRGGTWSRDGIILFAGNTVAGLASVPATGGPKTPVARAGAGIPSNGPRWPVFLPDGRHFVCYVQLAGPEVRGVYFGSLDSPDLTRLFAADSAVAYASPGYLLGVRQDRLEAWAFDAATGQVSGEPVQVATLSEMDNTSARGPFSVSTTGVLAHRSGVAERRRLAMVDRAGRALGTVGPAHDPAGLAYPDVSPDGRRVGVSRLVNGNNDVWLADVARGVETRFTSNSASDQTPIWSPDQSRMVFSTIRNGNYDLFEKSASGTADEQPLLVSPDSKVPVAWSPDGKVLLYRRGNLERGDSDIWALPLTGARQPFAVLQSSFDELEAQFSPDGRWIAYASNESGRFEISIRRFPGPGDTIQVSSAGGSMVRWRKDGRELYYVAADAMLMAVPVSGGNDGQALNLGTPVPLFRTRLATGSNITGGPQWAVMPDGRFLMNVNANDTPAPPITVVLNWQALLRK